MAYVKLNHEKVNQMMRRKIWRPVDLAANLGISKQHVNYILKKGGLKYAPKLAELFDCAENELKIYVG